MRKKLTNDVGATLVLSSAAAPANGTTEFVAGGVRYLPAANFNGTDAFTYEVCGNDGCDHILRVTDGSDHHGIYRPEDRDDAVSAALTPFATRDKTRGDGSMKSIRGRWLAPATALAIAVGAGAAIAGIPAADGTINGCYDKQSGQLRLTDPETGTPKSCGAKEIAVQWNQTGPQGETGLQGTQGVQGETGLQGTQGVQGDPGLKGDPGTFAGSFASPNGQFTLTVTDSGIVLEGPGGMIAVGSTGVSVLAANNLDVTSGGDTALQTGGNLALIAAGNVLARAGSGFTADAGGQTTLNGASVRLNGCTAPVARAGDPVVSNVITSGSPSVCAG